MAKYSPIEKIYIKNFRILGEVTIDFSESPIVALVGGNDAGKTSIIKAFEVCALHYNATRQARYIRRGTQMFGVGVQLADGTAIRRIKTKDVNKYEVEYTDGNKWSTTKIAEGLPVQVSDVMGMVVEPETKEYLQVRTYENKLLFSYTPASVNYKVMYDALKVGKISDAIRNGIEEANGYYASRNEASAQIRGLQSNLKSIKVYDLDNLTAIRDSVVRIKGTLEKIEELKRIRENRDRAEKELGVLKLIEMFKLEEVNELIAFNLLGAINIRKNINELSNKAEKIKEINSVELIDLSIIDKWRYALDAKKKHENAKKELEKIDEVKYAESINEKAIIELINAIGYKAYMQEVKQKCDRYSCIIGEKELDKEISIVQGIRDAMSTAMKMNEATSKIEELNSEIKQLEEFMKQSGVGFEVCPNCGVDVMIDYSKVNL